MPCRRIVCRVDLGRVVTAAVQTPDFFIRHVGHHCRSFRVFAEKLLANVAAVASLEHLILAVDSFLHQLAQFAGGVLGQQRIPTRTPDHLDHVPARAAERRLQLLNDLAVATHRAVEALQVAVDDKHQVVESFAYRHRDRAHGLRLVHFTIAKKRPDFAIARCDHAAVFHVAHEAGLVDRHHRAEAHGDRRELPVVGHQPGMWIR